MPREKCSSHPPVSRIFPSIPPNCFFVNNADKSRVSETHYISWTKCVSVCCSGSVATGVATFDEFSGKIYPSFRQGIIPSLPHKEWHSGSPSFFRQQFKFITLGFCELPKQKYFKDTQKKYFSDTRNKETENCETGYWKREQKQNLPESTPEDEGGGDRGTHPSARTICTWVSPLVPKSNKKVF